MTSIKTVRPTDPPYLQAAFSVLGLSEIEGARHEKRVLEMYAASGHPEVHDDETPWCAALIGWSLDHGGLVGTHSLMAISYAKYGTALSKASQIPRGAIAVWKRVGGNHVNFVLDDDGTYVTCMGGNQENGKGGGVTISRRLKSEALAYRLPPSTAVSRVTAKPPAESSKGTKVLRAGGAVLTTIAAGTQMVSSITGPVAEQAGAVKQIVDQTSQVVDVTTSAVKVIPIGFWQNSLAFVQSPKFLVVIIVLIGLAWAGTYYLRRRHEAQS